MDNASKALIMAGAILISVAVIGVGIYIFSAGSDVAKTSVSDLNKTGNAAFNQNFYTYANEGANASKTDRQHLYNLAKGYGIKCYSGAMTKNNGKISNSELTAAPSAAGVVTYNYLDGKINAIFFH